MPVVVLTSSAEPRELAQCYQAGANSCVRKPIEFREFAETLRAIGRYWLGLNRAARRAATRIRAALRPSIGSAFVRASGLRASVIGSAPDAMLPRLPCSPCRSALALVVLRRRRSARRASPPIDIPYQRFVLPNGLTLLVHEDHKAPIVAVNVWYHVGSKNERPAGPASPTCSST